jgi:tetratricopeptide (TPR) repeat protein
VDTQTRHALKQDKLVQVARSGASWLGENRSLAIQAGVSLVVVITILVAGLWIYHVRSTAAQLGFGEAMDTYTAPLAQSAEPAPPGEKTFANSNARARAANQQFAAVASRYGMLEAGKNARYFQGITNMEMGQYGPAEAELKEVAGSYDSGLASLAKVALASLYQKTGKTSQAIDLYQQLIAKPTLTVPATAAQLQLAQLYETVNPAEAHRLYSQLKSDKGDAGRIAAQKLGQN